MILPSRTAILAAAAGVVLAAADAVLPGAGAAGILVQLGVAAALFAEHRIFLAPKPSRPAGAVEIERRVRRTLDLDEPEEIVLVLRNRLGLPVDVEIVEHLPEALETDGPFDRTFPLKARVPAQSAIEVTYRVTPRARGPAPIPGPWLRVGIVGGLASVRTRPDVVSECRVVPARKGIVRYDTLRRSRNLAALGIHVGAGFTRGREFDRLREYHVNDDYRDIDWKATARRGGDVVTRVFRPERRQDVIVAVDASRRMTARAGGLSKLDEAVNAALVLAHVVTQGGDRCGLIVFDSQPRFWMAPESGPRAVNSALDALYGVAPSQFDASFHAACTAIARRQTRRALVVFLTDLPDAEGGDEFVRCLAILRRHLVACFTVGDRATAALAESSPVSRRDLGRTLAAAELLEEKRLARRRVTEAGAFAAELPPGGLAAAAVNKYLDAKARAIL